MNGGLIRYCRLPQRTHPAFNFGKMLPYYLLWWVCVETPHQTPPGAAQRLEKWLSVINEVATVSMAVSMVSVGPAQACGRTRGQGKI